MKQRRPFSPIRNRFSMGQGAIIVLLLFILLGNVFYLGYRYYEVVTLHTNDKGSLDKLNIVQKILDDNYLYSDKVPDKQIFDGAIEGMANAMGDPYTRYVTEKDYEEFAVQTEGTFGGIGVMLGSQDTSDGIVIGETVDGNGADVAGLKPNDRIVEVDGTEVKGVDVEEAVSLIRGDVGTNVTLKVEREGEEKPLTVEVKREAVEMKNVSSAVIAEKYGYIRIERFARNSITQFDKEYKDLKKKKIKGLIIDLRQNPGGLVTDASEIASRFIGEGKELVKITSKNYETTMKTGETPYIIKEPVVILVDQQSASASEILSGALKDYQVATIVGENTYGKGLIQDTFKVDEKSMLIITVSEYVTPKGHKIQGTGVKPDVEVKTTAEELVQGIDTQLNKALDTLEGKVSGKDVK